MDIKIGSIQKFVLLLLVVFMGSSCTHNVAKIDNSLKKYFEKAGVDGSFSLMNNQKGEVTVYNLTRDTMRISPGDMFKIAGALVGLESQRVTDTNSVLKNPEDTTLAAVTLKNAFDSNNQSYFESLTKEIGRDTMSFWLDSLHYGNLAMNDLRSFWNNGELKISPDEQLGLLTKIYFDKLPFQKYAQGVVRSMMLKEDNTKYSYSYTTGNSTDNSGTRVGWAAGWVEENQHVYFFITTVAANKADPRDQDKTALKITNEILNDKGYFTGDK